MENNGHPNPSSVYPTPTTGPLVEQPVAPAPLAPQAAPVASNYNVASLVIFILLLLTFFSPLGSALFLPIVLAGVVAAFIHIRRATAAPGTARQQSIPRTIIFTLVKIVLIVGAAIALGWLCLIGFFFILLASNGGRMGS